jgi:predicted DNA-binding WGR domain protein
MVTQEGKDLTIVFGKIGTNGQTTNKSFSTSEEATVEMEKLVKSKIKKGYKEVKK